MSAPTEPSQTAAIQQRMRELRDEMNDDVEALVNSTEDLADWRKYVRAQPWLCVGAAALAGFLLAPGRKRAQPAAAQAATKAGVAGGLGGALFGALTSAITNRAAAKLGEYVVNRFNPSHPESQPNEPFRPD